MFCITQESDDPFLNLAAEEILLKNSREEYLILGINTPSLIIGKHQSAHKEADTKFLDENKFPLIRRISGGGTVFHDKGNLNFTFIKNSETGKQVDFRKYTQPVIDFLYSLGVEARFEGKNDIKLDGYKISGNAEHVHRNRVLHHGTLLFSSSLDMMSNSIRKDKSCYSTRGVDSNPASVMNLNERLKMFHDIYEFRDAMKNYFLEKMAGILAYTLTRHEKEEAQLLSENKYRSWEWNYAYGPEYIFEKSFNYNGEPHFCSLFVKEGVVTQCSMTGSSRIVSAAAKLTGCRHMVTDIQKVFMEEKINLSVEEIYNFF